MQYVDFKHDGKKVSRFGLGCMRFPTIKDQDGKDVFDEQKSIELVRAAIDSGVNYIDTAYFYGESEAIVGKALKDGYREKVILATKLPVALLKEKADLQKYYEEELARLQVEHIDVYFLHNLSEATWEIAKKFDAIDFMVNLKKEGKISYIAASIHSTHEHFIKVVDAFDWDLVMMQYNYYDKFNQGGIKGLHHASAKGIPVVSMESLHGGMLAIDVPKEVEAAFGEWGKDKTNAEKSFMWLYNQPEVTVILSGVSSMEHLEEDLKIFENAKSGILTEEQESLYDKARDEWNKFVNIECTDCKYCMPCPAGVDIPMVFQFWNELAKSTAQKWLYSTIMTQGGIDASKCVSCGKCVKVCPQKFDIPARLKEAHAALV